LGKKLSGSKKLALLILIAIGLLWLSSMKLQMLGVYFNVAPEDILIGRNYIQGTGFYSAWPYSDWATYLKFKLPTFPPATQIFNATLTARISTSGIESKKARTILSTQHTLVLSGERSEHTTEERGGSGDSSPDDRGRIKLCVCAPSYPHHHHFILSTRTILP